jgi:RecA-family ATPase
MSMAETAPETMVDISQVAYEKLDRWRDVLDDAPKMEKRATFVAAATDIYEVAERETNLAAYQSIDDALNVLGSTHAGLDWEDIDFIKIGAKCDAKIKTGPQIKAAAIKEAPPVEPAALITPSQWPQGAPPPVDWLVAGRIPRGDVTTLHGDGGAGKTDIAIRLAANVARGAPDWLGHELANGPAALVSGEEPEREVRRRLWLHAERDGYTFASLNRLHLWTPNADGDTVLATPDRNGIMRPTRLMQQITAAIEAAAPVLVVVDNVASTFAGNQNDRVMVRSYVNLWRAVAHGPSKPAVLLLDHPSLSGLTTGTGRGGNMDWRNAVRSALYLRPADDKAEADQGIRILETVKCNYAAPGKPVRLQWAEGGLQLEHAPSSLHRLAIDAECEATFLRLLDQRIGQGRHVGEKNGRNYAPKIFADSEGNSGFTSQAFAKAMERLFAAEKIAIKTVRIDGKNRQCIDRAGAP